MLVTFYLSSSFPSIVLINYASKCNVDQEPITQSLHLPYKPYETTFARIFLFLETAGLLNSRTICYTVQYNTLLYG